MKPLIDTLKAIKGSILLPNDPLIPKINLTIVSIKKLLQNESYSVRVGIKKLSKDNPKFLDSLLADPLRGDQRWYTEFQKRDRRLNHLVIHAKDQEFKLLNNYENASNRNLNLWQIPSTILSKSSRSANFENLNKVYHGVPRKLNDLQFLEINDEQNIGNCNVNKYINLEMDMLHEFYENDEDIESLNLEDGCHFYIYHTNDVLKFPIAENLPHLRVVDIENPKEVEKKETLDENTVFINSDLAHQANDVLMENYGNTSEYIKLLQESNLLRLIYEINVRTSGHLNLIRNLKVINYVLTESKLYNNGIRKRELEAAQQTIKQSILEWSREANEFLQKDFTKNCKKFRNSELNWYNLFNRGDDLDYYLDIMVKNSIKDAQFFAKFSYLKGQILALSQGCMKTQTDLRENFDINVNKEVTEMQDKVSQLLVNNVIGIQMPSLLVSAGLFWLYGVEFYTISGVLALSTAIVCNNISRQWVSLIEKFEKRVQELMRVGVLEKEQELEKELEETYNARIVHIQDGEKLVSKFGNEIKEFEKGHEN